MKGNVWTHLKRCPLRLARGNDVVYACDGHVLGRPQHTKNPTQYLVLPIYACSNQFHLVFLRYAMYNREVFAPFAKFYP